MSPVTWDTWEHPSFRKKKRSWGLLQSVKTVHLQPTSEPDVFHSWASLLFNMVPLKLFSKVFSLYHLYFPLQQKGVSPNAWHDVWGTSYRKEKRSCLDVTCSSGWDIDQICHCAVRAGCSVPLSVPSDFWVLSFFFFSKRVMKSFLISTQILKLLSKHSRVASDILISSSR